METKTIQMPRISHIQIVVKNKFYPAFVIPSNNGNSTCSFMDDRIRGEPVKLVDAWTIDKVICKLQWSF